MDIQRPSYEFLKFTKRIEVYRNHKRLMGCAEKKYLCAKLPPYLKSYHMGMPDWVLGWLP